MSMENLAPRAAAERSLHNERMVHADFNMAPFTIAWEVTRACAFACVHCRADAQHARDPRELDTEEAKKLIDRLADFGSPILIFTGRRPDDAARPVRIDRLCHAKGLALFVDSHRDSITHHRAAPKRRMRQAFAALL
jgi:2-iminoacetate synthase ThiH